MSPFQLSLSELANTISKQAFSRKKTLKRQLRLAAACAKLNLAPQTSGLSTQFRRATIWWLPRKERASDREGITFDFCQVPQRAEVI